MAFAHYNCTAMCVCLSQGWLELYCTAHESSLFREITPIASLHFTLAFIFRCQKCPKTFTLDWLHVHFAVLIPGTFGRPFPGTEHVHGS